MPELLESSLRILLLSAQGQLKLLATRLVVAAQDRLELLASHFVTPSGHAVQTMELFTPSPHLFASSLQLAHGLSTVAKIKC